MEEGNEMLPEDIDENFSPEEIAERKKWQKRFQFKAGQYVQTGDIKKCRKIYFNIESGRIRYEITRGRTLSGTLKAPYAGGPMGPGGGAYDWGDIKNIKIIAETPAKFYVHVEWTVSGPFDVIIIGG